MGGFFGLTGIQCDPVASGQERRDGNHRSIDLGCWQSSLMSTPPSAGFVFRLVLGLRESRQYVGEITRCLRAFYTICFEAG